VADDHHHRRGERMMKWSVNDGVVEDPLRGTRNEDDGKAL
jgi:hypothetical protein